MLLLPRAVAMLQCCKGAVIRRSLKLAVMLQSSCKAVIENSCSVVESLIGGAKAASFFNKTMGGVSSIQQSG